MALVKTVVFSIPRHYYHIHSTQERIPVNAQVLQSP